MTRKHILGLVTCPACKGSRTIWHQEVTGQGDDPGEYLNCPVCGGRGLVTRAYYAHWQRMCSPLEYELPTAAANGRVIH